MTDHLAALLEAAKNGDDRALGRFVVATQPALRRLCQRLGSPGEEDDLTQEIYLRAVRALPAFRGDAPALAWLLAIGRHTCADHVRRRQRQRRVVERVRSEPLETAVPAADTGQGDDLLDQLTADRRDAFVATQLGGLSYAEAADALGCPIGTVRSRVARARADLLALLTDAEAS